MVLGGMYLNSPRLFTYVVYWSASSLLTGHLIQIKEDLNLLKYFDTAIKAGFVGGLPLHVSDLPKSDFCVMSESEFEGKSVQHIQEIMRWKHILVTDLRSPILKFDAKGLSSLASPMVVTSIQGM